MLRPLTSADAPEALDLMIVAFQDLSERVGDPPDPVPPDPAPGYARIRHLVATDPGGAWAAERDGRIVGLALALVREGVWGLSLLVVHPEHQSGGLGRALLGRALEHGEGTRGGIILSSSDHRALRAYAVSGFEVRPSLDAKGPVRRPPERPEGVRAGRWPDDAPVVDAAGRFVRGASHALDVPVYLANGRKLHVHAEGDAFLVSQEGAVVLLAARDERLAADLLRAHLHDAAGGEIDAQFLTAGQDWAVRELLAAGVDLRPGGAVFTRGEVGPMAPYLPSGAYL